MIEPGGGESKTSAVLLPVCRAHLFSLFTPVLHAHVQAKIAAACLTYLSFGMFRSSYCCINCKLEVLLTRNPLLVTAQTGQSPLRTHIVARILAFVNLDLTPNAGSSSNEHKRAVTGQISTSNFTYTQIKLYLYIVESSQLQVKFLLKDFG